MRKRHRIDEILGKLRESETALANGGAVEDICRTLAIDPATLTRWQRQHGSRSAPEVKRLKELEKENLRLKKAVAELILDKAVLQEAAQLRHRP